jgi:hypothetical protein
MRLPLLWALVLWAGSVAETAPVYIELKEFVSGGHAKASFMGLPAALRENVYGMLRFDDLERMRDVSKIIRAEIDDLPFTFGDFLESLDSDPFSK